jgi:hypothetical protein
MGPAGEATLWLVGLAAVAIADPTAPALIDLCPLKALGVSFCPGCGLGHAMGYLARGEWMLALRTHPLAPAVAAVLLHRIASLYRGCYLRRIESRQNSIQHVQSHQIPA